MNFNHKDKYGFIIIGVVFFVVILLVIFLKTLSDGKVRLDKATHCPKDVGSKQHYVFIVDATDSLSPYQFDVLNQRARELSDEGEVYDRYSIYSISSSIGGLSKKIFDECRPDDGEDVNPLTSNSKIENAKFKRFQKRWLSAFDIFESVGVQDSSPLVEAWSDLSQLQLRDNKSMYSKVMFFSDLLQNTLSTSVYKGQSLPGELYCQDYPGSSKIEIYVLERPSSERIQSTKLVTQWRNLIGSCLKLDEEISFEKVRF